MKHTACTNRSDGINTLVVEEKCRDKRRKQGNDNRSNKKKRHSILNRRGMKNILIIEKEMRNKKAITDKGCIAI